MSLASILSILSMLPSLFGLVDNVVQSVEATMGSMPGATKHAAAVAKVNSILTSVGADATVISSAASVLTPLINASVAAFNATGIFRSKAAPTA